MEEPANGSLTRSLALCIERSFERSIQSAFSTRCFALAVLVFALCSATPARAELRVENAISRSSIAPAPRDAAFPCRFHDCCCAEQGWCKSDCCCFADARATSTYERVIDAIAATSRALERSRASIDHPLVRGAKASREPCRRRVRALGACAPAGASVILERAPSIDDARADDRTRSSCAPSFARESPRVEPATPPPRALS